MTAKERQHMLRLEIENAELRERVSKDMRVFGDQAIKIIEQKASIELAKFALGGELQ